MMGKDSEPPYIFVHSTILKACVKHAVIFKTIKLYAFMPLYSNQLSFMLSFFV